MKSRVGEKGVNNQGCPFIIVAYRGTKNCDIQFEDGTLLKNREYWDTKKGTIKNPNYPTIYNIGFLGQGEYFKKTHLKIYQTWHNIFQRCYCIKFQEKQPTYIGCSVDERWHNFQNFAKWYEQNYKEDFDLDKDILVKGNKIYSPDTCCFVPQEVNKLFIKNRNTRGDLPIGVSKKGIYFQAQCSVNGEPMYQGVFKTPFLAFQTYKRIKEKEIKDTAKACKSSLDPRAYQAMMNWRVEITD